MWRRRRRRVRGSGWGGRFARRCATAAPALSAAEGSAVLWAEPAPRERTAQEQWDAVRTTRPVWMCRWNNAMMLLCIARVQSDPPEGFRE